MSLTCVACGLPIPNGEYRLIGVEQGSWKSCYVHRGACEADARERFGPKPVARKRSRTARAIEQTPPEPEPPEVEELSLEAPDPFPEQELPWFGAERRR